MSTAKTGIEWAERTWNPIRGCSRVSPGCQHCYAERVAWRFHGPGQPYEGLVQRGSDGKPHWTSKVVLDDAALAEPLRWRKPARVFVNSMSDLFHEHLGDGAIDRIFAVMALCPQHTFLVLTKRAKRMRKYLDGMERCYHGDLQEFQQRCGQAAVEVSFSPCAAGAVEDADFPLPNVWLGVSAENQETLDERAPELLAAPAAVRWVSLEPLLMAVELRRVDMRVYRVARAAELNLPADFQKEVDQPGAWVNALTGEFFDGEDYETLRRLDWVVLGGESGPGARPMHPDWARRVRDDCADAGVPFFFKQWGEWAEAGNNITGEIRSVRTPDRARLVPFQDGDVRERLMLRVGKKAAGRLLDGREHSAYPVPAGAAAAD